MKYTIKYFLFTIVLIVLSYFILFFNVSDNYIILNIRLPRLILAIFAGGILSMSGALMQGILENPLADPFLLGISGGAILGSVIGKTLFAGNLYIQILFSFLGGLSAFFTVLFISSIIGGNRRYSLIIVGIMISSLSSSIVAILNIIFRRNINTFFYLIMGSLNMFFNNEYIYFYLFLIVLILILIIWIILHSREMDIISSGVDIAYTSGINVKGIINMSLIITALLVSIIVSFTGIIGFVGIMVPHLIRKISPSKYIHIYIMSFLGGAILLIVSDFVASKIFVYEIPIGVITSLIGIPFLFYLMGNKND